MTDMDSLQLGALRPAKGRHALSVLPQSWGYVIRSGQSVPLDVVIGQVLSYVLGVCFVIAAAGILVLPLFDLAPQAGPFGLGAATLLGAGAAYLLWFSSRGGRVDIQIDTEKREIREAIVNRVGNPTVIKRYDFGDIGGVYQNTGAGAAPSELVIAYRGQFVLIAEGRAEDLSFLRDKLSRDLSGPVSRVLGIAPRRAAKPAGEHKKPAA